MGTKKVIQIFFTITLLLIGIVPSIVEAYVYYQNYYPGYYYGVPQQRVIFYPTGRYYYNYPRYYHYNRPYYNYRPYYQYGQRPCFVSGNAVVCW